MSTFYKNHRALSLNLTRGKFYIMLKVTKLISRSNLHFFGIRHTWECLGDLLRHSKDDANMGWCPPKRSFLHIGSFESSQLSKLVLISLKLCVLEYWLMWACKIFMTSPAKALDLCHAVREYRVFKWNTRFTPFLKRAMISWPRRRVHKCTSK